jgi:hypothetical protein
MGRSPWFFTLCEKPLWVFQKTSRFYKHVLVKNPGKTRISNTDFGTLATFMKEYCYFAK